MGCLSITRFRTAAATLLSRYDCTVGRGCNISTNLLELHCGMAETNVWKHSPFHPTPKLLLMLPLPIPAGLIKDVIQAPHCIVDIPYFRTKRSFTWPRNQGKDQNVTYLLKYLEYNVCYVANFSLWFRNN